MVAPTARETLEETAVGAALSSGPDLRIRSGLIM